MCRPAVDRKTKIKALGNLEGGKGEMVLAIGDDTIDGILTIGTGLSPLP
jgi:hypothetical protein